LQNSISQKEKKGTGKTAFPVASSGIRKVVDYSLVQNLGPHTLLLIQLKRIAGKCARTISTWVLLMLLNSYTTHVLLPKIKLFPDVSLLSF